MHLSAEELAATVVFAMIGAMMAVDLWNYLWKD